MAIKSRHEIAITIDSDTFNLTVIELSDAQLAKLEKKFTKHTDALKKVQKAGFKLQRLTDRYTILKEAGETKEALAVLDHIEKVEEEIEALTPTVKTASAEIDTILKERLEMSLDGEDKEQFLECLEERNVSYKTAFDEITRAIADSSAKK